MGTGVGLFPIPEDIIVLSAGIGIQQDIGNLFTTFIIVFMGVLISDSIIFFIGEKIGRRVLDFKFFSFFFPKEKVEKVSGIFDGHIRKIVFIGRFAAGFRPVVFLVAGISKLKFREFISIDILASLLYIPFIIFLGYRFSYDISRLIKNFKHFYHAIDGALILIIAGWFIFRFSKTFFNNKPLDKKQ